VPYAVRRKGLMYDTYNPLTGRVYGRHPTKAEAEAQRRALYAKAPPGVEGFPPLRRLTNRKR
jgi:hypothetical protein